MMNLNEYTKEDLIGILTRIGEGKSFEDATKGILTKEMRALIFKMHTAFCRTQNCGFGNSPEIYENWLDNTWAILNKYNTSVDIMSTAVDILLAVQAQNKEVLTILRYLLLKHIENINDSQT